MENKLTTNQLYSITIAGVIFGSLTTPIMAVLVRRGMNSEVVAFYRLFFISLWFIPLVFSQKKNREAVKNCDNHTWLIVMGYSVTKALSISLWAESIRAGATPFLTTALGNLSLVFIVLFSYWFFHETTSFQSLIGIGICMAGVVVAGAGHITKAGGGIWAITAMILASGAGAGNTILGKVGQRGLPVWVLIALGYGFSTIVTGIFAVMRGGGFGLDWSSFVIMLFLSCIATFFSHSIPIWAVAYTRPITIQVLSLPTPFFTAIASYFLLGEIPSTYTLIGSIIIGVGLAYYLWCQPRGVAQKR